LEDYKGGRDWSALDTFASSLKPVCSPSNIDLCSADDRAQIEKLQAMSEAELTAAITEADGKASAAESFFTKEVEKLQASYKKLSEDKEKILADVKASGVGMLKAVKAAMQKAVKAEL